MRVPRTAKTTYSLPRSSGQGGRKLFVIHLEGKKYELGIEHHDLFRLFSMAKVPTSAKGSSETQETGTSGLEYLTDESEGIVWDLGTFEVVEGSFDKGYVLIYLSGRKLNGEWRLSRIGHNWKLGNVSGALKREIPVNASALAGTGVVRRTSKDAA